MNGFGLTEKSISGSLADVISTLRKGELDQALRNLKVLGFQRLQTTIEDRTKGTSIRFRDAAEIAGFDTVRVNDTGDQIARCLAALERQDREAALGAAEDALARWEQG